MSAIKLKFTDWKIIYKFVIELGKILINVKDK
jgi:hypothetical protein